MPAARLSLFTLVLGIALGVGIGTQLDLGAKPTVAASDTVVQERPGATSGAADAEPEATALADVAPGAPSNAPSASADADAAAQAAAQGAARRISATPAEEEATGSATIEGLVVDGEGAPIADVTIVSSGRSPVGRAVEGMDTSKMYRAWQAPGPLEEALEDRARSLMKSRRGLRRATTDANGRFTLRALEEGEHRLTAYKEDYSFAQARVSTGEEARIVGTLIGAYRFDVRMPDGSAPATAVIAMKGPRRSQPMSWTPEQPVVRVRQRTATFVAMVGDVRRAGAELVSELASEPLEVDLERDGPGPHVLQLAERSVLRVTVEDETPESERAPPWVRVVPEASARGRDAADVFEGVRPVRRLGDRPFEVPDLAPGTYVVGVGRSAGAPEVTDTVEVGAGVTEHVVTLGALEATGFLVARVLAPPGEALGRLRFRSSITVMDLERPTFLTPTERGDGVYWIPIDGIVDDETWTAESEVSLTVTSTEHGSLTQPLELGQTSVDFEFLAACTLDVRVEAADVAGLSVAASPIASADAEVSRTARIFDRPTNLDADGRAQLTGLQPGLYRVALTRGGRSGRMAPPLATAEVLLESGVHEVVLVPQAVHELVVHAPGAEVGARVYLTDVDATTSSMFNGWNAKVGEDHRVTFTDIPAGDYLVRLLAAGFQQMRVTVPSGEVEFVADVLNAFVVESVAPGKLGAAAGLREGDVIVGLNGRDVNSNTFYNRLAVAIESAAVTLTVERGGRTTEVSLGPTVEGTAAAQQIGVRWRGTSR